MADGAARSVLGAVRAVTYTAPDLRAIEAAYIGELGYVVAARGRVPGAQARAWGAPAVEGWPMLTLGPASGEAVYLRFIESADAAGWRALRTLGWNATEFAVQDVEALADRLRRGRFEIIGPPARLTRFPTIRAMQALGPAGECCYFTQIGADPGLDLAQALSFVGRVFIVIAAGSDVDALYESYSDFANPTDPPVATPVRVISHAHGLPADTLHRHGLIKLPGGTRVELDEYPISAAPRISTEGALPPGMAVVSFDVETLGDRGFIAPPAPSALPGTDRVAACVRGVAGEIIELIAPARQLSREARA
jgi:hypothetical protein